MKKTIIGMMVMAVAIMMTLSSAVFAADTISATTSGEVKVGENVTVTITHPEGTTLGQYNVKYDADMLTYVKDSNNFPAENGTVEVYFADNNKQEVKTTVLTFTAKKAGEVKIKVDGVKLQKINGEKVKDITTETTVKIVEATPAPAPAPAPENNAPANNTPNADTPKADGDKPITNLKDAKTGFDAMYVVYLAAAVVVAGGIVRVATKR